MGELEELNAKQRNEIQALTLSNQILQQNYNVSGASTEGGCTCPTCCSWVDGIDCGPPLCPNRAIR